MCSSDLLPKEFAYVIEELITEKDEVQDKEAYYNEIVHTIIRIGRAPELITALCYLIQRLVIDHLHIVGDVYDRGPGPHIIMDTLSKYHSVDMQWGNHDIVWMGAASGELACIAHVIRMSARYGNLAVMMILGLSGFLVNYRSVQFIQSVQHADCGDSPDHVILTQQLLWGSWRRYM